MLIPGIPLPEKSQKEWNLNRIHFKTSYFQNAGQKDFAMLTQHSLRIASCTTVPP